MNKMALSKNLTNLCLDVLYDYGKTITNQISKSGKEEERLQFTLHRLIKVFKLWNLPNCIQQNDDIKWKIRVQDVQTPDCITLTLCIQSSEEFERFNAYLRHLVSNWFQDIKVQKLSDGCLSFVVTHPAPVLLHFFPQDDTNLDEHSRFSTSKSSHVEPVSKIISLLVKDFGLCILNAPEKLSGDTTESKTKEMIRSQNPDEYPEFQNDILTTDFHYNRNTPSDVLLKRLKQAYISASNGSQNPQSQFEEHWLAFDQSSGQSSQNQASEVEHMKAENAKIKKRIATLSYEFETQRTLLQLKIDELIDENKKIAAIISEKDAELQETFLELGRTSVELTRVQNEKKRNELFNKTYKSHIASTQTSEVSEWSATTLRARNDQTTSAEINRSEGRNRQDEGHHEQESLNETASLTDISHSGVEGNIYNNYKLLLLRISHDLLKDDVLKLKRWVEREFEIDTSGNVNSIFLEMDRKKVISTTDLNRLKTFFENILRFDFVCLIESYVEGDYRKLKNFNPSGRLGSDNRGLNGQIGLTTQRFRHLASPQWSSRLTTRAYSTGISHGPADQSRDNISGFQRKFLGFSRSNSTEVQVGDTAGVSSSIPRPTQRSDGRNGSDTQKPPPVIFQGISIPSGRGKGAAGNITSSTSQGVVVTDGGRREESEVQASSVRGDQANASRNTDSGSNGQKLSKPQRPDSSGSTRTQNRGNSPDDDDSQWLCSHYKRRCYVQFECCNKFWPCHRCHNNQSTCGRRKLKSRDTKRVKCVACGQEQEFAQHCSRCNAKFARYFCGLCKHLTGTDDNPYHCEKCGICRIHGDRSFHCDICGVCLDVQLRGNHKCREGSAHDECCICLEDAFTGCQILPCSHKVHKECATQMIRSGITRCPICRESFAHKLERRPNPSKKPPGKQ